MSERPEAEIEDVLSSIRKLVAGDQGQAPSRLSLVLEEPTAPTTDLSTGKTPIGEAAAQPAFVLTPESRLADEGPAAPRPVPEAQNEAETVPEPEPEPDTASVAASKADDFVWDRGQEDPPAVPETQTSSVVEMTRPEAAPDEDETVEELSAEGGDWTDPIAEEDPVDEAPMIELGETATVVAERIREDDAAPDDWPLDMSSPAARAAMTARLGAMRAQWESDAAADAQTLAKDAAEAPPEEAATPPVSDRSSEDAKSRAQTPRFAAPHGGQGATDEASSAAKAPAEPERRPIWSRVQPEIERVVRETLEPAVKSRLSDINDMLVEPDAEEENSSPAAEPDVRPVFARATRRPEPEAGSEEPSSAPMPARAPSRALETEAEPDFPENLFGPETGLESAEVRAVVVRIVHEELQGALGERITRNVRKLVRREIQRALASRDFD